MLRRLDKQIEGLIQMLALTAVLALDENINANHTAQEIEEADCIIGKGEILLESSPTGGLGTEWMSSTPRSAWIWSISSINSTVERRLRESRGTTGCRDDTSLLAD
jgi:hypothetical protein